MQQLSAKQQLVVEYMKKYQSIEVLYVDDVLNCVTTQMAGYYSYSTAAERFISVATFKALLAKGAIKLSDSYSKSRYKTETYILA